MLKGLASCLLMLCAASVVTADSLSQAISISQHGMALQAEHLKIVTENIANELSAPLSPRGQPYRRKIIYASNVYDESLGTEVVKVIKLSTDPSPFKFIYEPSHPAANSDGLIAMPNIDKERELNDAAQANMMYKANAAVLEVTKDLMNRTIDLLK